MASSESTQLSHKRKRKKSFLKNARKYGKRGYFGRGSQLDADTYQYFIRIMEVYNQGFSTEEEKLMLVNNVFAQTENEEINCSSNQVGCRVIQLLLPFANDNYLQRYIDAFMSNLRPLACDRFASHVLQTLVEVSQKRTLNKTGDEFVEKYKSTVIKISRFLLNNLEDYVWDTYGNHVIRTVLANLSQVHILDEKQSHLNNCRTKTDLNTEIPEEYVDIVKDYAERLVAWPQFSDFAYSELTSGLLQILLMALHKVDKDLLKLYLKKFMKECFAKSSDLQSNAEKQTLSEELMSKPVIMLLETSLEVAPKKVFKRMFTKCFKTNLALMATTRNTNFAVQKLMNYCEDKEMFEEIFEELSGFFQGILDAGHSGVILTLGQTCKRLATKQGIFMQNIMKVLNCYEPEERQKDIIMCLCKFIKYEDLQKPIGHEFTNTKLNLHGVLLIQVMLEFNKPIQVVNSILSNNATTLKNLFSNTMGSHIIDSYMNSKFVGGNSREKMIRLMQGSYQELATSKYGSRSFEAIWNTAPLKQKLTIMNELSHKDALWSKSEFGKIIAARINLPLYKKNVEEWKNSLSKAEKK